MSLKYPENGTDSIIYADDRTNNYYSYKSAVLAEKYAGAVDLYSSMFKKWIPAGGKILDIGCGSGRDLATLTKSGFRVAGVDTSGDMLDAALNRYPELAGKISLSGLPALPAIEDTFNGVLCSAVLQHIPDSRLYESFRRIRELLKDEGIFLVSFPIQYPGIDSETRREGTRWSTHVYRKEEINRRKPIHIIDSILRDDSKVTTYKFALLRALAETASYSYNSATWLTNGMVAVDINIITEKWLEYYWPIVTSPQFIIQGQNINKHNKSDITFRDNLKNYAYHFKAGNSLISYQSARNKNTLSISEKTLEKEVLKSIKDAIIKGPVQYSGSSKTGGKIFSYHKGNLLMATELWQEFALMGRWIEDSIILRWADFSVTRPYNKANNIKLSTILDLLLYSIEAKRDDSIVRKILEQMGLHECVWSGKTIKKYDIDHALPFSIWRNNDIWNLFPADPKINNSKRDKLPSRKLIESSRKRISNYWDMYFEEASNLFLYQAGKFCGVQFTDLTKDTKETLFSAFSETVEVAAEQRCADRWEV
jgi:SAM-dependent methyltransferase